MSAHKDFLEKKWKALERKQFTDCSFLVGPEDGKAKIFHGIKADLMIASGFMEKLFTSPLCPPFPIRIVSMHPNIFKMIMEFAHLGVVREPIVRDDDALELAIAADHFLIDSMKDVCIDAVGSMVTEENIWSFLEGLSVVKLFDVSAACHLFLEGNTRECLNTEGFLSAPPVAVQEMLKLDRLEISEKQLLEYCCEWARKQDCFRDAMRVLLPHLLLFTLSPEADGEVLSSFLTTEEQLHVLHFNVFGTLKTNTPATLNTKTTERKRTGCELTEYCVTLIPDKALSSDLQHLREEDVYCCDNFLETTSLTNCVTLKANIDVYLTGIECVGCFPEKSNCKFMYNKVTNSFEKKPNICLAPDDSCEYEVGLTPCFYEKNIDIVRSVQTKFGYYKIFRGTQFIPKGEMVTVEITMECKKRTSLRLQHIEESTVNQFLKNKDLCKDFDQIELKYTGKLHYSSPIFVRNIRYMKRWDKSD